MPSKHHTYDSVRVKKALEDNFLVVFRSAGKKHPKQPKITEMWRSRKVIRCLS